MTPSTSCAFHAAKISRAIWRVSCPAMRVLPLARSGKSLRSEEHTSELQSPCNLVCRLLLEKNSVSHFPGHLLSLGDSLLNTIQHPDHVGSSIRGHINKLLDLHRNLRVAGPRRLRGLMRQVD